MPGELAAPYRPPCYYNGTWPDSSRRNILLGGCQQHWRESEQNITRWRNNMPETPAEQATCEGGTLIDHNCYVKITLGATATAVLTADKVTSITLDDPNTYNRDYTFVPTVTISGGGGTGATAHAVLTGDAVTSIEVDTQGSGYTSVPDVSISIPKWNLALCDKSKRWKAVSAWKWAHGIDELTVRIPTVGGSNGTRRLVNVLSGVGDEFGVSYEYDTCPTMAAGNKALFMSHVKTISCTVTTTDWTTNPDTIATATSTKKRGMDVDWMTGVRSAPEAYFVDSTTGDPALQSQAQSQVGVMWGLGTLDREAIDWWLNTALLSFTSTGWIVVSTTPSEGNSGAVWDVELSDPNGHVDDSVVIHADFGASPHFTFTHLTYQDVDGTAALVRREYFDGAVSQDSSSFTYEYTQNDYAGTVLALTTEIETTGTSVLGTGKYAFPINTQVKMDQVLEDMLEEWDLSDDIVYPWVATAYGNHPHLFLDEVQDRVTPDFEEANTPPSPATPTYFFDLVTTGDAWTWDDINEEWIGGTHPTGAVEGAPAIPAAGELIDRHYWFEAPTGGTPGAWNTDITGLPRTATRWLAPDTFDIGSGSPLAAAVATVHHQHTGVDAGLRYMQKMVWSIPTLPSLNYFGPCGEMRTWKVGTYDSETQTWSCSETLRFPDAWAICGRLKVVSIDGETKTVTLSEPATYLVSGDTIDFTTYDTSFVETVTAEEYTVDTVAVDKLSFTYTDEIIPEGDYIKDHGAPHYKWYDTNPKGDFIKCEVTHHGAGDSTDTSCVGACIRNASCTPMIIGYSPNTDVEQWPDNARVYDLTSCDADTICGAYWTGVTYGGMTDPFHPQDPDTCEPIAQSVEAQCLAPTGATVPADKSNPPVPYITLGCNGPVQLSPALNPPEGAWV